MDETLFLLIFGFVFVMVTIALVGVVRSMLRRHGPEVTPQADVHPTKASPAGTGRRGRPDPLAQLAANPAEAYQKMRKSIRSWGYTLIGFGALSFVLGGILSAPWGVAQVAAGLMSFYFSADASMFAFYSTILVWAAFTNVLSGQPIAIGGGVLQLLISTTIFRLFRVYRKAYQDLKSTAPEDPTAPAVEPERAPVVFPWLALVLSLSGAVGFVVLIVMYTILMRGGNADTAPLVNFLGGAFLSLGELGAGLGAASLFAGFSKKAASITAIVVGVLIAALTLWTRLN